MMKRLIVIIVLVSTAAAQGISPKFKAAGRIAFDAMQRVENAGNLAAQPRLVLAEQALDNAKRTATTSGDKKAYNALQLYADAIGEVRYDVDHSRAALLELHQSLLSACKSESQAAVIGGTVPRGDCDVAHAKVKDGVAAESARLEDEQAHWNDPPAPAKVCEDLKQKAASDHDVRIRKVNALASLADRMPENTAVQQELQDAKQDDDSRTAASTDRVANCFGDLKGGAQ